MAGLPCRVIAQVAFKAGGDVFHHLFVKRPHHLANVTPAKIQACEVHQGEYGTNGSVLKWKYTLGSKNAAKFKLCCEIESATKDIYLEDQLYHGKEHSAKVALQDIDESKKQISIKMLEGDLLEVYKNMIITVHVETKGGVDFVTWTVDYELLNADNPHPLNVLNFYIEFTKEIEAHIFG